MYVYLYSNLIWSIAQPRLAVIFVTQYLFCVSSCPSCISCFVTSSMATPCSIFSYKLTKSPFLLTEWAIYLSAGINSYESTAHKRVNSTLEGNHPVPQETRREENSKGTHLKFLLFFWVVKSWRSSKGWVLGERSAKISWGCTSCPYCLHTEIRITFKGERNYHS